MCSSCYVKRNPMLQTTQYSPYNTYYESVLKKIYSTCGLSGPTDIPPPLIAPKIPYSYCVSGKSYMTSAGDICDTIAQAFKVSSASMYTGNFNMSMALNCSAITTNRTFCLPLPCDIYTLQANDTCSSLKHGF
jgi:hypothetical protein